MNDKQFYESYSSYANEDLLEELIYAIHQYHNNLNPTTLDHIDSLQKLVILRMNKKTKTFHERFFPTTK